MTYARQSIKQAIFFTLLPLVLTCSWAEMKTLSQSSATDRPEGSLCFESYAPATPPGQDRHKVLVIDKAIRVPVLGKFPRTLADHLDLQKKHQIQLVEEGKVLDTWTFRFKPNTTMMNFWRSKGYWHV